MGAEIDTRVIEKGWIFDCNQSIQPWSWEVVSSNENPKRDLGHHFSRNRWPLYLLALYQRLAAIKDQMPSATVKG